MSLTNRDATPHWIKQVAVENARRLSSPEHVMMLRSHNRILDRLTVEDDKNKQTEKGAGNAKRVHPFLPTEEVIAGCKKGLSELSVDQLREMFYEYYDYDTRDFFTRLYQNIVLEVLISKASNDDLVHLLSHTSGRHHEMISEAIFKRIVW